MRRRQSDATLALFMALGSSVAGRADGCRVGADVSGIPHRLHGRRADGVRTAIPAVHSAEPFGSRAGNGAVLTWR